MNHTILNEVASPAWDFESGILDAGEEVSSSTTNHRVHQDQLQDLFKRGTDMTLALLGIMVTLPLWGLIALAIKVTSRGPVFFCQERAGLNGKSFRMYKFRTMVVDAEEQLKQYVNIENLADPVYKIKDDPRVTRPGKFLRRYGLDEIPQLLNVLRGDMSLVGPRPEVVALVARYTEEQRCRLLVKPGITGYQQIHNRGMPDMTARLVYDFYYLRYRSIVLDLWILAMTLYVITSGEEITY